MVTMSMGYSRNVFFVMYITGLAIYILIAIFTFTISNSKDLNGSEKILRAKRTRYKNDLKYILIWTTEKYNRIAIPEGQDTFLKNNCSVFNCFATSNKSLLHGDYTNFDAIIFNSRLLEEWLPRNLPRKRLPYQKYIFHSKTPPEFWQKKYINSHLDDYFNITWTYKLSSDIVSPFIEVKDLDGNVVAPNVSIEWKMNEDISKVDDIYDIKSNAAATVLENCKLNNNVSILRTLQAIMKRKSLKYDVFGCQMESCRKKSCEDKLKDDYFFYIVHEFDSYEDYVTKNILYAYKNKALPVIMGNKNYDNFLPAHSYIETENLSPHKTVLLLRKILKDKAMYLSFFHWNLLYTIHEVEDLRGICELCAILNSNDKLNNKDSTKNFRQWWFK